MECFLKNTSKYLCALLLALALGATLKSPAWAADPSSRVPPLKGRLVLKSMPLSPIVGRKVITWTYLPPGYDALQNAARRYPVVYLLHGQPGGWTDCFLSGRIEEMADLLISGGQMAPVILVAFDADGPRGARDLTNFCNRVTDGYRAEDMIVQELVPYVDSAFRTLASPTQRALWGYSAGGFGALNLGLRHPDVWKVLASHAGFYQAADDPKTMRAILGEPGPLWAANSPLHNVRLLPPNSGLWVYMDASPKEEDFDGFVQMRAALRAQGVQVLATERVKAHAWRVITQNCRDSLLFAAHAFAQAQPEAQPQPDGTQ